MPSPIFLWYNQTRFLSTLACVSPVRFEQNWLAAQAKQVHSSLGDGAKDSRGKVTVKMKKSSSSEQPR